MAGLTELTPEEVANLLLKATDVAQEIDWTLNFELGPTLLNHIVKTLRTAEAACGDLARFLSADNCPFPSPTDAEYFGQKAEQIGLIRGRAERAKEEGKNDPFETELFRLNLGEFLKRNSI